MVALCENSHTVDSRLPERTGEFLGIEVSRHIGNEWRSVKIEMDLPLVSEKRMSGHAGKSNETE